MKILLYLLAGIVGLVVVAVLVLMLMSFRRGAGTMTTVIEIDRPPEVVWPWLTEADKQKQWVSWLVEVKDLTPDVKGVGKKFAWVMDDPNMKQHVEIVGELIAEEPLRLSTVRLSSEIGFDGTSTWTLTDLGGRTRFESEGKFRYDKWLYRLMEPMITPQAKKKQELDFAKLKSLVEANGK
jgi:uncharacterized protein YndB with AHSA1/START domain